MTRPAPTALHRAARRAGAVALVLAVLITGCSHKSATKAKNPATSTSTGAAGTGLGGGGAGAGSTTSAAAGSASGPSGSTTTLPGLAGSGGSTVSGAGSGAGTGSAGGNGGTGGGSGAGGAGGTATTTAGPGDGSSTATATATATTLPISANVGLVKRVFARLYTFSLNDQEASCVDRALPPADLQALDAGVDQDPGPDQIVGIALALARCEPAAFLEDQASLLVETAGVTPEQANCIGRAVDALALTDRTVAGVLLDDWAQLPAGAAQDAMVAAAAGCVDHDTAVTIVTG